MEFMCTELVIILGIILDITSAYPYGEQRSWDGVPRRSHLREVFLPRLGDFTTLNIGTPSLREDFFPGVNRLETRRMRRRKIRLPESDNLAPIRKPRRRGVSLDRLQDISGNTKYPVFDTEDTPTFVDIFDYVVKAERGSRRSKRGRARSIRTTNRQHLLGNSDSMDTIDGNLYHHTSTTELSLFEQLSIELARLRCEELRRQRDALRVLEMADPSSFQHRSDHRNPPC